MHPSGLIFLLIVAIWATYLIQHWVRRREHLATARSVDRFSEAMRVLERRSPLPESSLTAEPRSYSFGVVRPARPEVVVKHPVELAAEVPPAGLVRVGNPVVRLFGAAARRRIRGLSLVLSLLLVVVAVAGVAQHRLTWWAAPAAIVSRAGEPGPTTAGAAPARRWPGRAA